jgi:hypothetical protein
MMEEFHARRMEERRHALSLPDSVRWIVRSIKRSKSRRGHTNMRKHDVQRKHMSEVVMKCSGWPSGQVLLKIDWTGSFLVYRCVVLNL